MKNNTLKFLLVSCLVVSSSLMAELSTEEEARRRADNVEHTAADAAQNVRETVSPITHELNVHAHTAKDLVVDGATNVKNAVVGAVHAADEKLHGN